MKRLNIIAACSENLVIGNQGKIPWRIPEDNVFLKRQTCGQIVILGRKVLAEWPSVLKGRNVIVVTTNPKTVSKSAHTAPSLKKALAMGEVLDGEEIYVCGGVHLFREAISQADRLYLTLIKEKFEGDAFFPANWMRHFDMLRSKKKGKGEGPPHEFLVLDRSHTEKKHLEQCSLNNENRF